MQDFQNAYFRQSIVNYLTGVANNQQSDRESIRLVFLASESGVCAHLYNSSRHVRQVEVPVLVEEIGFPGISPEQAERVCHCIGNLLMETANQHKVDYGNLRFVLKIEQGKLGAFTFNGPRFLGHAQMDELTAEIVKALLTPPEPGTESAEQATSSLPTETSSATAEAGGNHANTDTTAQK